MYDVTAEIDTGGEGRRVMVRVPLPAAPAVVWDAVATGEGISSWFVPCAMEPQVGGRIVQFADPGAPDPTTGPEAAAEAMLTATVGEITAYSPPSGSAPGVFTYVERDWMGEGVPVPPWETTCEVDDDEGHTLLTLRSGFDSGGQLAQESVDGSVDGWVQALTVLAHRLTHRPADGVATVDAATEAIAATVPELWARVSARLIAPAAGAGGAGSVAGGPADRRGSVARSGEVGGIVVVESEAALTLILSAPVDGMLELFAFPAGETHEDAAGGAAIAVRAFEYVDAPGGDGQPLGAAAVDVEPTWDATRWRAWLSDLVTD
ncbi:SRPBCC family protein [Dietzia alimentaria]|uniref:SRPBCC family protein n=1 Tax=Dietzia alimentaria TaxID=665550 RepID=UPI00029A0361|nr:SRPBCC domain-containing protein [Dietzia alimentaria]